MLPDEERARDLPGRGGVCEVDTPFMVAEGAGAIRSSRGDSLFKEGAWSE